MRSCLSCLRPLPTPQESRKDRRQLCILGLLILTIGLSIGYLLRHSVFLKRENNTLSGLLNAYVKRVETDKLVDENKVLRAKGRHKMKEGGN
jgi:PhoPQ-activated pathogenicity-related protein